MRSIQALPILLILGAVWGCGGLGSHTTAAEKIYITDGTRLVRVNDMEGNGWITLGSQGSGLEQFDFPEGMAIDSHGRIYVTDGGNNRIVRMETADGTGWTTFGTSGTGINQFNTPIGITVAPNGQIYIGDWLNQRVVRIDDMTGTGWTELSAVSGPGHFSTPVDIKLDDLGHMYVVDYGQDKVIMTGLMSTTGWTELPVASCESVAIDNSHRLYVTSQSTNTVNRYNSIAGDGLRTFGGTGTGYGQFNNPTTVVLHN